MFLGTRVREQTNFLGLCVCNYRARVVYNKPFNGLANFIIDTHTHCTTFKDSLALHKTSLCLLIEF